MNATENTPVATPAAAADAQLLQIDLDAILTERFPRFRRMLPDSMMRRLEHIVRQDELNEVLRQTKGLKGADFCRRVLKEWDIKVNLQAPYGLPDPKNRRVCIVSNHPLGGLDGLALIASVQRFYGGQVWFVVNDLLMAVKPLESVFLPVNKFGHQDRKSVSVIDKIAATDDPIIMFPAGMVSRLQKAPVGGSRQWAITDLEWRKMFVNKAHQFHRDIIPVHFSGENSKRFYRWALWRKRLGMKFNIEQVLLPQEMLLTRGKEFTITVGIPVKWDQFQRTTDAKGFAQAIKSYVYVLPHLDASTGAIKNSLAD